MISINLVSGTTTDSTPISFTLSEKSNEKIAISGNDLLIKEAGFYEITGMATVTSSETGDYGLAIYANDNLLGIQSINEATASGETSTIPLNAIANVTKTNTSGFATINIMPVSAPTIVSGIVSIKKIV